MLDVIAIGVLWIALGCAFWGLLGLAASLSAATLVLATLAGARGRWQAWPLAVAAVVQGVAFIVAPGSMPWSVLVFAAIALFVTLWLWWWPIPHLDPPTGPHAVGLRIIEFFLKFNEPPNEARSEDGRRMQVYLWYPAKAGTGSRRRLQTRIEATAFSSPIRLLGGLQFLLSHYRLAHTFSFADADVLACSYPVVVFNHGGAMWPSQSSGLLQDLASHGYVVCSIAHPGESAGVAWNDGTVTPIRAETIAGLRMNGDALRRQATFQLSQDDDERRGLLQELAADVAVTLGAATKRWADDSMATVDLLMSTSPPEKSADVVASSDFTRLAYAGMSLGGSVAFECCCSDPRAKAGINLDGMNWSFERIDENVPVPFLQIYGDPVVGRAALAAHADAGVANAPQPSRPTVRMQNDFFYESAETRGTRADVIRVVVRGAAHMAFTDHVLAARGPVRKILGIGPVNGRRVSRLLGTLSLSFLDRYLKGNSDGTLEATIAESGELFRQELPPQQAPL